MASALLTSKGSALPTLEGCELSTDVALQVQRVLSDEASDAEADNDWTKHRTLESRIDELLLSQAQPLTLTSIDKVQTKLRSQLRSCQARISEMTREMECEADPERMSQIQVDIAALLEQLHTIREKARESESVVKEITRDIRSLDIAKRNVVASMTALKRLQMLVNGVDQLERLTESKRYREAASAMQAVRSLLDFFQSYKGVERVAAAWKQVDHLQNQLRTSVMKDYEQHFLHESKRAVRSTNLAESALVIDAIGPEAKTALIEWYCSLQLREYRRIFRATDEAGQLDNVSRRFAWFRRVLKTHEDEHAAAFLEDWKVERWLIRRFVDVTKEDLRSVLIREQSRLNAASLMEALNSTLEFEAAVSRKYNESFEDLVTPSQPSISAQAIVSGPSSSATGPALPPKQPVQTLSAVFDPYLTVFVEAQDRALSEIFVQYRRQGANVSHDGASDARGVNGGFAAEGVFGPASTSDSASGSTGGSSVLPSSTEMFYFYRQTLEQCARLSNREAFRDLCQVYKKWLRVYAEDVLRAGLVRSEPVRRSIDARPNTTEIQRWCLVLNTAAYCATTSNQLESKLREKIHADFRDGVSLEEERDIFNTLIAFSVQTLARELELCSEPIWAAMLRPSQSAAGGKSQYMADLASLIEQVGVVVRQDVENKRYVRSWCDKVVVVLAARFTNNIVRLRPISNTVAEQLLVDAAELRKIMIELPRYPLDDLGLPGAGAGANDPDTSLSHWLPAPTPQQTAVSSVAASYVRYVHRLSERIEILLRVVMAPVDQQESISGQTLLVPTYLKLVGDRSFTNFQKILDLKGVRKVDQNGLLERFVQATRPESAATSEADGEEREELADQSFLTQLDMDPATQPILQSPFNPATPSFLDANRGGRTNSFFGNSVNGNTVPPTPDGLLSPTAGSFYNANGDPSNTSTGGAGRAFSDLRKFGNFFGAALGRREDSKGRQ